MEYDPSKLQPRDRYKVLTAFVLPRPIAWVTTLGPTGVVNAAPFSFFNVFGEDPPLIMFAINKRPDGRLKDTLDQHPAHERVRRSHPRRARWRCRHAQFERRLPAPTWASPTVSASKLAPSMDVKVPRLADAPWAMECKTWQIINVKEDRQLIIGEGTRFHIRDLLVEHQGDAHPHGARSPSGLACSPTATAAPTTAWISRPRRARWR